MTKKLPNGNLLITARADGDGVVADGVQEIAPDDPRYQEYLPFAEDDDQTNRRIVLAALMQARADGDDASAATLEALLADPKAAAEYVARVSRPA